LTLSLRIAFVVTRLIRELMNPLIELKSARQPGGGRNRRWFTSNEMDLIVWYDSDAIARFELYYDKNSREHVLIWGADSGFMHLAVDDGEQKPVLDYKESPILIPDGDVNPARISGLFEKCCANLPVEMVTQVRSKLSLYSAAR